MDLMKKISIYWALVTGFLSVIVQFAIFFARFGRLNAHASPLDYLLFFLAGTLGGGLLVYFLNRQSSTGRRWFVLVAFLLASPIALILMVGGGLLGPLGVIIFPLIPWTGFLLLGTWVGTLVVGG